MAVKPILPYPHPLLKSTSRDIADFGPLEKKTLAEIHRDMAETASKAGSPSISAVQIGLPYRAFYITPAIAGEPLFIVNPHVTYRGEVLQHYKESCVSCPGIELTIQRSASITIVGRKSNGDQITVQASGILAQAIGHELNHLDGRCIIDCAKPAKRRFLTDKMRQYRGHDGMLLDYNAPVQTQGA